MGDVLAVGDAYQAQQGEMFIKECNSSGLINRTFYRQRGISGKSFFYWLRKIRSQMAEVTAPHLVQLEPLSRTEDVLQIQYRGAEMKLPAGVDLDAVAALLRSIESPMMNPRVRNYYSACGYTDLGLGIDGLAAVVTQQYGSQLNEESLFLFCGRRT